MVSGRELVKALREPHLSDQEVQELFAKISKFFYRLQTESENPVIIPVRQLLEEIGVSVRNPNNKFFGMQTIRDVFRSEGIPVGIVESKIKNGPQQGIQKYYFIWVGHVGRAVDCVQRISIS